MKQTKLFDAALLTLVMVLLAPSLGDGARADDRCTEQCEAQYDWCTTWFESILCNSDFAGCLISIGPCEDEAEAPGGTSGSPSLPHPDDDGCHSPIAWSNRGLCEVRFASTRVFKPGKHGCPAGTEPGEDDQCIPRIRLGVVPVDDGFWISCPGGTRPSPIDGGCVIDTIRPIDRGECPPGSVPNGPDDQPCAPVIRTNVPGMALLREAVGSDTLQPEIGRIVAEELANALFTTDLESAMEVTGAQLGMELVRADQVGPAALAVPPIGAQPTGDLRTIRPDGGG